MTTVAEALDDLQSTAATFQVKLEETHEQFKDLAESKKGEAVKQAVQESQAAMNQAHKVLEKRIRDARERDAAKIRELEDKLANAIPADGAQDPQVVDKAMDFQVQFNAARNALDEQAVHEPMALRGTELIAFQQRYQEQTVQWFRAQGQGPVGNDISAGRLSDGGFLMPPAMTERIRDWMLARDPMWQIADVMETTAWEADIPTWVGEPEVRYEDEEDAPTTTGTSKIVNVKVPLSFLSAYPRLTRTQMKSDSDTGIVASLESQVRSALTRHSAKMFTVGPGHGKMPSGIANRPVLLDTPVTDANWGTGIQGIRSGHATQIFNEPEVLRKTQALLEQPYQMGTLGWGMNRTTFADVQTIKLSDGTFPFSWNFQPTPGELGTARGMILGDMVYEFPSMSSPGTENNVIALYGDFEQWYAIRYMAGIAIMVNPYTEAPFTKFHVEAVNGGRMKDYRAGVYLVQKGP